tara:strand:+ start:5717 stop:5953 length:237 start_codon:yes stop_codon:yes gene_type:complete
MKVNVLQASDISFKKWRWWSDWIDVCVFDCLYRGHILQMKVSRRNGKKFKCVAFKGFSEAATPCITEAGDLTQMKGNK